MRSERMPGSGARASGGRRWHDDPADYEGDNEKWGVPGRHGYTIVFATWAKVTRHSDEFLREIRATIGGEKPNMCAG
jgi:hypothetical protein